MKAQCEGRLLPPRQLRQRIKQFIELGPGRFGSRKRGALHHALMSVHITTGIDHHRAKIRWRV